jgi:DNA repair protein RecN (Recombination protein N)
MLKALYIKNYALFLETRVEFGEGMNVITGETGAGKSLLVGALGLILGKRADTSVVFFPDQKCIVEAVFTKLPAGTRKELLEMDSFDLDEDRLLIRREVHPAGKSRAFVNDTPVSLQQLREIASLLFDLHGQHEHQLLLAPERQLDLLDQYAGCAGLREQFREKLQESNRIQHEIRDLERKEREARQQQDYLQFQLKELEEANLQEEEEAQLEGELNLLENAGEIRDIVGEATESLYNQDESLYNQLSNLLRQMGKISAFNPILSAETEKLTEAQQTIKEAALTLSGILDSLETDPERMLFVEERIALYHRLKLKFGLRTTAELIAMREDFREKTGDFDSLEFRISSLRKQFNTRLSELLELGISLEKARKSQIPSLEKQIQDVLAEVGFNKAEFNIQLDRITGEGGILQIEDQSVRPSPSGMNSVSFRIRTNPGLPAGLLSEIASGGELSRVMLAIKSALADKAEFSVLIFDEIDTGISGEIANKVGKVMQGLSGRFQILAITHLPQIAAKGDHHYMISKETDVIASTTRSSVKAITGEDRILELAKMLSGDEPTESAKRNARELIRK